MPMHNLTQAARIAGVGRSTIVRYIKNGKLVVTRDEQGERVVDSQELVRVFGKLKGVDRADDQPANRIDLPPDNPLVDQLRDQLADAKAQLRLTQEQVQQATNERSRLLALLEAESAARRALEQKLLPAPPPQPDPPRPHRLWILLLILVAAIAGLVWTRSSAW